MARSLKSGFDYFPLDTDFFSDRKIKILRARYGADGITVYLYLLCEIYKSGFFVKYDSDFEYIIADDLNMSADKIKQIISFLCERSLLDSTLLTSDTVMTSCGIQKRYLEMAKKRTSKVAPEHALYWLLPLPIEKDTSAQNDFCGKNEGFCGKNGDNSENTEQRERESEKSESKAESESKNFTKRESNAAPENVVLGQFGNVFMTEVQHRELCQKYGKSKAQELIDQFSRKLKSKGYQFKDHYATILAWATEDRVRTMENSSFDTDDFFEAAVRRSYDDYVLAQDQKK